MKACARMRWMWSVWGGRVQCRGGRAEWRARKACVRECAESACARARRACRQAAPHAALDSERVLLECVSLYLS